VRERALRDREDATQRAHQAMTEEKEIMMEKVGHLMAVADKTFQVSLLEYRGVRFC